MQEFTLDRTNDRQLVFTGEVLAQAKSPAAIQAEQSPKQKRHWFTAAVYRTKGGKFVLQVLYRFTGSLLEQPQDMVSTHDSIDAMYVELDSFDARGCINGFPNEERFADKQESLMTRVDEDFGMLTESIQTQLASKLREPERID